MHLLLEMLRLWLDEHLFPDWMHCRTPDNNHFYRRMFSRRYQAKKRLVKHIWMVAGLLILCYPLTWFALLIGLPVTLLSFAILDETP